VYTAVETFFINGAEVFIEMIFKAVLVYKSFEAFITTFFVGFGRAREIGT
jgi:hypothetical protein